MATQQNESVLHHATYIKSRLQELTDYLRKDATKAEDPKARALFETTAEALTDLLIKFTDFEPEQNAGQEPGKADNHWPEQEQPLK